MLSFEERCKDCANESKQMIFDFCKRVQLIFAKIIFAKIGILGVNAKLFRRFLFFYDFASAQTVNEFTASITLFTSLSHIA